VGLLARLMQILDNHTQRVNRNFKNIFAKNCNETGARDYHKTELQSRIIFQSATNFSVDFYFQMW
jgi:hypothetical protein